MNLNHGGTITKSIAKMKLKIQYKRVTIIKSMSKMKLENTKTKKKLLINKVTYKINKAFNV